MQVVQDKELKEKLVLLPDQPGVYLFKCKEKIIYVGKAVVLKNRVRSYFRPPQELLPKVRAMVEKADDVDWLITQTELEALILECNLIKAHRPHYNILLKDDKQYPYLRVDMRQPFPRLEFRRNIAQDGARYLGPFSSAGMLRAAVEAVQKVFPLRTCVNMPTKGRPCIRHPMGMCMAPCTGRVSSKAYHQALEQALAVLTGKADDLVGQLEKDMKEASTALDFERAAQLRDRWQALVGMLEKQNAQRADRPEDMDVHALLEMDGETLIQSLWVREGKVIGAEAFMMQGAQEEAPEEVMRNFLQQYYSAQGKPARTLLVDPLPAEQEAVEAWLGAQKGGRVTLHLPQRGVKKEWLEMARKNAKEALLKYLETATRKQRRGREALEGLAKALDLPAPPQRIECFDISNTQGTQSVASMVVFEDGAPASREYRHFRIKTVEGADDFASMAEVITRRLKRGLEGRAEDDGAPKTGFAHLPDVIIVDGGAGQLSSALAAMHDLGLSIPMFGLAKQEEEIIFPHDEYKAPLRLPRHHPSLRLLTHIRDEAHRFAITHHRSLRQKNTVRSALEGIAGLGEKRQRQLLKHFGTVANIRKASLVDLAQAGIPQKVAETVFQTLHAGEI